MIKKLLTALVFFVSVSSQNAESKAFTTYTLDLNDYVVNLSPNTDDGTMIFSIMPGGMSSYDVTLGNDRPEPPFKDNITLYTKNNCAVEIQDQHGNKTADFTRDQKVKVTIKHPDACFQEANVPADIKLKSLNGIYNGF